MSDLTLSLIHISFHLFHALANEKAEKTGLATLVLFDLVGECRKHSINHRFDGSRIGNLFHAALRNDRRGVLVFFKDSREQDVYKRQNQYSCLTELCSQRG